jgi:uncharacterized protein (TIGR02145 family)
MKSGINVIIIILFTILFLYSCTDSDDVIKKFETGTVSDIEGNQYITVKIGDQWWIQEDLKVTKLRTGQSIPFFGEFDNELWSKTELPGYCAGETGLLYNFYAVQSNMIAPEGWHVATDEDWKKLESYLGMDSNELDGINWRGNGEGNKLKQDYQESGWLPYENNWSNNESGFNALACGCRLPDGRKCSPSPAKQGFWWSSSTFENKAWFRNLDYKKSGILRYFVDKNYGMSIRCVKD